MAVAFIALAACGGESPSGVDEPAPSAQSTAPADFIVPGESESSSGAPTESTPPPSQEGEYSTWPLQQRALPKRADGFGEILPTPATLRNRRYPTEDVLPAPPQAAGFQSTIGPVTPDIRQRMGEAYSDTCPVPLEGLAYVTVSFRGFDGRAHTGELVVAADQAQGVVGVFGKLFETDFPIEEMRLVGTADLNAPPYGDGNNTAATVCRTTRGSSTVSAHASGIAVDINPFMNPYLKGDVVLPERASAYLDRDNRRPGMMYPDSVAVREFARIGWEWGGNWQSLKDYQHFSANGR